MTAITLLNVPAPEHRASFRISIMSAAIRPASLFLLSLSCAVGVASAQDGVGPGGRGRGGFGAAIGFSLLDTNRDGILDSGEIDAAPSALSKLDKDSDGKITVEEARAAMPQGRGRSGPGGRERDGENSNSNVVDEMVKTLMGFDANGDGKLSRSELPDRFQGIFDRADENHDGFLTREEIRKVAAAQAATGVDAGRDGRPEGGRGRGPGDMNPIRMDPILAAIDVDGDGVLSAEEIRNAPAAIRKLDKDGDGKVNREEAMAGMGRGR